MLDGVWISKLKKKVVILMLSAFFLVHLKNSINRQKILKKIGKHVKLNLNKG